MLYVKLALRNMKRSIKEYSIYITTLIISVMLIYSFNSVTTIEQVSLLIARANVFGQVLLFMSVFVVVIIGWLIYYISNFIMQRRSKEFGLYLLLGMTKKQVVYMFLIEQFLIGLFAFFIGCFLGIFTTQIMVAIISNIFHQAFTFKIVFSFSGCLITFVFFMLVYVIELLREQVALRRMKIYDLLYSDHKNEKIKKDKKITIYMFLLGIVSSCVGIKMCSLYIRSLATNAMEYGGSLFLGGSLLIIASMYLFFTGTSSALVMFMDRYKQVKYKGNTLFIYRSLAGRLRTNRSVLATLSVLTLATLLFVCVGMKFNEVSEISNERYTPYDIMISQGKKELDVRAIQTYLDAQGITYQALDYEFYEHDEKDYFVEVIQDTPSYYPGKKSVYIKESHYNTLRSLKGLAPIDLGTNGYGIVSNREFKDAFEKRKEEVHLHMEGKTLGLVDIQTQEVGQVFETYYIIVPDDCLKNYVPSNYNYVLKTSVPSDVSWYTNTKVAFREQNTYHKEGVSYATSPSYVVKANWIEDNLLTSTMINFCLFYFAIIFVCISATILAIQQLSSASKQKYAYGMLWKMGVSKKEVHKILWKQVVIYFLVPMILPLLYVLPLLQMIGEAFTMTYTTKDMSVYLLISVGFYAFIYICYFLLTYFGCKRNIDMN